MKIAGIEVSSVKVLRPENVKENILKQRFSKKVMEYVDKNKWISIPNKNLYFNKKIMACFPNFNNNFQEINCNAPCGVDKVLKKIAANKEYSKYGIKWDIPNPKETQLSFYGQGYPWKDNNNDQKIYGWDTLLCKNTKGLVKAYRNDTYSITKGRGLIIPILRLGADEDYNKIDRGQVKFEYSSETILFLFCLNDLIPDFGNKYLNSNFKEVYGKIQKYTKYIIGYTVNRDKKIDLKFSDKDEIKDELMTKGINGLTESEKLEFTLENGDVLKIEFSDNINISEGDYTYENGDIEECKFQKLKNGDLIKAGNSVIVKKNGDVEKLSYSNGVPEGESECTYKNGDIERRTYKEGILQGNSEYTYINGDREIRNYTDGVVDKEVKLYSAGEDDFKLCRIVEGEKKDVTLLQRILDVDKIRVNLSSYDENILTDPNRGHWDIKEEDLQELENIVGKKVYIRDAKEDIKRGGIVGIDFGTKSTVVVFQDDRNQTFPMRISGGNIIAEAKESDYENPTVIEFKDIETFMNDYNEKEGRPLTKWNDVTVSHTAFQNLIAGTSDEFYSIISELKQWAGLKDEKIIVRDKKGVEKVFPPYMEFKEGDVDPIELYAYYIGSYINNMTNGIYMEYFLSFPVTYEKKIRERILQSFERGIKKALPVSVVEDESAMKKLKVRHGANEPAAYAVCALQEYGFEPEDDEIYHYGVFDFGGGTADFDFGIWKTSENERKFDYELTHFGAGGDRYLGGENILKELAYEVLKENHDTLRKENISFAKPEWCDRFVGDEGLVDNSPEAKLNIKVVMEKLRPFWEKTELDECTGEKIKANLYAKDGSLKSGIVLEISEEEIEEFIEKKIDRGIENFFIAMNKAMKDEAVDKINIFLAGNSCKHPKVMELFEKHRKEFDGELEIFPALGTKEAYAKMAEREIEIDESDKTNPTGKTGVAYGIIDSRAGGRIDIRNIDEESNIDNEINFKYYVGYEGRKKLKVVLGPQTQYEQYVYYLDTTADVFDLYYTTLPEAMDSKMPIDKAMRKRIELNDEYPDAKIYIKAVSPDTLKYTVTEKDIEEKEYLEEGEIKLN